ncbi:hypothetical protein RDI58_006991 [Solanum bulbocastanum]|uniref:Uncharacterized protein n=1 Tax=Solanum bulbocastanum TaxID=147425 RepID=A0AAN8TZH9_SOLBU
MILRTTSGPRKLINLFFAIVKIPQHGEKASTIQKYFSSCGFNYNFEKHIKRALAVSMEKTVEFQNLVTCSIL